MDDLKALAPLDDEIDWYQWERVVLNMPQKKGKPGKTKKKYLRLLHENLVILFTTCIEIRVKTNKMKTVQKACTFPFL